MMPRAYSPRLSTVHLIAAILARPGIASCRTIPPGHGHGTRLRITLEPRQYGPAAYTDMTLPEARAWLAADIAQDAHPMQHVPIVPPPCVTCGEGPDYGPHADAAACDTWMRAAEGRPCTNPAEHHPYAGAVGPIIGLQCGWCGSVFSHPCPEAPMAL